MFARVTRRCALLLGAVILTACDLSGGFKGMAVDPPRDMPSFAFTRADG